MHVSRTWLYPLAAALFLLVEAVGGPQPEVLASESVDPSAREWNQAQGNAARTSSSVVSAVRGDAVLAWRTQLSGKLLSEPVTWGGMVYIATEQRKTRELVAIRASTGDVEASKLLGNGDAVTLAVWSGLVIVTERGKMRAFKHQGDKFGTGWSVSGKWSGEPCVHQGLVFAAEGSEIHVIDALSGRKLAKAAGYSEHQLAEHGDSRAIEKEIVLGSCSARVDEDKGTVLVQVLSAIGDKAYLTELRASDLDERKPKLEYPSSRYLGQLATAADPRDGLWGMTACRLSAEGDAKGEWVVVSRDLAFKGGSKCRTIGDADVQGKGSQIETGAAIVGGRAYGFDSRGDLRELRAGNAGSRTLIKKDDLPKGAFPGPATLAGQSTLVFGNWALDAAEGRILWSRPDDAPEGPTIPAGDGRMVFVTAANELVCIADAAVAAQSRDAAAAGAGGEERPRTERPRNFAGVLLTDGRQFEGTFQTPSTQRVTITPTTGEPLEVNTWDVLIARRTADGEVTIRGEEFAAYGLWLDAVNDDYGDGLEELFRAFAEDKLVDEARRVLARAREYGMSEARANGLARELSGVKEHPQADRRKKRFEEQEALVHGAAFDGLVAGAAWCQANKFQTAATVLLGEAQKLGVTPADVSIDALVTKLIPATFPFSKQKDALERWRIWAEELLPASANFMGADDSGWAAVRGKVPWTEQTFGFRTPNLVLFCRDPDPVVCGMLVRNGEGAVRANQVLLKGGEREPVLSDGQRLEVRVHRNRKEFLDERGPDGNAMALPWSAGYYSPAEGVSRFYVSRGGENMEPLGRGIHEVLAHELTHHYISERWIGKDKAGRAGGAPGYWVVEGMARFVEDQSVEMSRRGVRFDDKMVSSLDAVSQLAETKTEKPLLFAIDKFVDMTQSEFHSDLADEEFGRANVKLRNSLKTIVLSTRAIYYEQAGSLTYFLMNERGEEGRQKLVDYMERYYNGRSPSKGWEFLGFESAEELDTEFRAFLKSLR